MIAFLLNIKPLLNKFIKLINERISEARAKNLDKIPTIESGLVTKSSQASVDSVSAKIDSALNNQAGLSQRIDDSVTMIVPTSMQHIYCPNSQLTKSYVINGKGVLLCMRSTIRYGSYMEIHIDNNLCYTFDIYRNDETSPFLLLDSIKNIPFSSQLLITVRNLDFYFFYSVRS